MSFLEIHPIVLSKFAPFKIHYRLINNISFKEKAVKDAFFLPPAKRSLDETVKLTSSGSNVPAGCSSIRQLLSSASEEFEVNVYAVYFFVFRHVS